MNLAFSKNRKDAVIRNTDFGVELGVDSGFATSYLCTLRRVNLSEPQGPRTEKGRKLGPATQGGFKV